MDVEKLLVASLHSQPPPHKICSFLMEVTSQAPEMAVPRGLGAEGGAIIRWKPVTIHLRFSGTQEPLSTDSEESLEAGLIVGQIGHQLSHWLPSQPSTECRLASSIGTRGG